MIKGQVGLKIEAMYDKPYLLNDYEDKDLKIRLNVGMNDAVGASLEEARQGYDLCILLERSNDSAYLQRALETVRAVIHKMGEMDRLSCITYTQVPYTVFQQMQGTVLNKKVMLEKLEAAARYTTREVTYGEVALKMACDMLLINRNLRAKHILFLTHRGGGGDKKETMLELAAKAARDNIRLLCLAFDETTELAYLERLTSFSLGTVRALNDAMQIEEAVDEVLGHMAHVVANDVRLKLSFSKGIAVEACRRKVGDKLYKEKVYVDPTNRCTLHIGQMEKDKQCAYYFSVKVPAQAGYTGPFRLIKVEASYYLPEVYEDRVVYQVKDAVIYFNKAAEN